MNIDFFGSCNNPDKIDDNVLLKLLQKSQTNGFLNLSNRNLNCVPDQVWDLNNPLPSNSGNDVDFERQGSDACWWEIQPICKLILSSNNLVKLPGDGLIKLSTVVHFDLRDNKLSNLPDELNELINLKSLILSLNQLTCLPKDLSRLQDLSLLDLANNKLESLNSNIWELSRLEKLDISNNRLKHLPSKLPLKLRQFSAHHNCLQSIEPDLFGELYLLQNLDLSHNSLESFKLDENTCANVEHRSNMQLATLYLRHNKLKQIPNLAGLVCLKELLLDSNCIRTVDWNRFDKCPIATLNLAQNLIEQLPCDISIYLSNLIRLDVSANQLTNLPTELGFMDTLQALVVDRNPLRAIRQDIASNGTEFIKGLLRKRDTSSECKVFPKTPIEPVCAQPQPDDQEPVLSRADASGHLNWAGLKSHKIVPKSDQSKQLPLHDSPSDWLRAVYEPLAVQSLSLANRCLKHVPLGLFAFASTLTSLDLSSNLLTDLPENIDDLCKLVTLNVNPNERQHFETLLRHNHNKLTSSIHSLVCFNCNKLTSVPRNLIHLARLTELHLDFNPIGMECVEQVIFDRQLALHLECVSLESCHLVACPNPDLVHPDRAPQLCVLNLANNDIGQLPPRLGLSNQLKVLRVEGNCFRIPRPDVVAKGTSAVLDYLRSRIPT